jgi:dTDP-4-dehydrorhamnose 3,5-epimerase
VEVVHGSVFEVVVDVRRGSPDFGHWSSFDLSGDNHLQVWIPAGFAHGFCVVSDEADVLYRLTSDYVPHAGRCVAWDDRALGIPWPITDPIMSQRDREALPLAEQSVLPA